MIIKSLEQMEKIVSKHKELRWVGWNVMELKRSDMGRTAPNGIRIKDTWYLQKTFVVDRNGWDIPSKYGN